MGLLRRFKHCNTAEAAVYHAMKNAGAPFYILKKITHEDLEIDLVQNVIRRHTKILRKKNKQSPQHTHNEATRRTPNPPTLKRMPFDVVYSIWLL